MNGYPIATEALDLEIYVLAALFAGSERLSSIEHDHPKLHWAKTIFERSEVSRRLISLAVMLRNQIEGGACTPNATVGVLTPDISKPTQKALSLREACNKVIHAEAVDLARSGHESPNPPLSSTVTLYGNHNDVDWQAELDALAFLNAACEQF